MARRNSMYRKIANNLEANTANMSKLKTEPCSTICSKLTFFLKNVLVFNSSWQTQFSMPVNFFLQNLCMSSIFNVECQELIKKLITVL